MQPQSDDDLTPEEARRDHREMLGFLAINAAGGVVIGVTVAAALVILNIGNLGTHLWRSGNPVLPFVMIAVPLASTFGAAVAGSAIMLMPYKKKKHRKT